MVTVVESPAAIAMLSKPFRFTGAAPADEGNVVYSWGIYLEGQTFYFNFRVKKTIVILTSVPSTVPLFPKVKLTVMTLSCSLVSASMNSLYYFISRICTHQGSSDCPGPLG